MVNVSLCAVLVQIYLMCHTNTVAVTAFLVYESTILLLELSICDNGDAKGLVIYSESVNK